VLRSAGDALVFDGKGHTVVDWGLALKNVRPGNMTLIKLPGRTVISGGKYRGEALQSTADEFFASVRDGTVAVFLAEHPDFINNV
jgi:polyisoprenyl-teichoic acid--peptidoglycan teichoic acid transferase